MKDVIPAIFIATICMLVLFVITYFTPNNIRFRKGYRFIKQKEFSKAKRIYSDIIIRRPNLGTAYLNRAVAELGLDEIDNAIFDFQKSIKIRPDYRAYIALCTIYYSKLKNNEVAFECINNAIDVGVPRRKRADFYSARGSLWNKKQNDIRALEDFNTALKFDPKHVASYNGLGFVLSNMGEYDRAIDALDHTIKLNPKYAYAYNNRGFAFANIGEYEKAFNDYEKSFQLDPSNAHLFKNRGLTLLMQKKYKEALPELEKAVDMERDFETELRPKIEEAKRITLSN
jgi:tetratricopeptide (TPR) repeat protein